MFNPVRVFFIMAAYLLIGWFVGAIFSEHIGMSISTSNFDSFWAWGWLMFWPLFLSIKFFLLFIMVVVVVGLCMLAWDGGRNQGWWN